MVMALFTGVLFASLFGRQRAIMGDTVGVLAMPTPTPEHTMGAIALPPTMGKPTMGEMPVPDKKEKQKFERGKDKALDQQRRDG